jgi:hypothetical protein
MAHFAQIDADNRVVRVLVVSDEQEHRGQDFLANDLNLGGNWIQTSYNNRIRKQFAGIGFTYNPMADVFITPKPYPSWDLDGNFDWQAPTPRPDNNLLTYWDENELSWIQPLDLPT